VLSVGRLEKIKRIDLLIEAMQHVPEAITRCIIGIGSQEEYLKKKTRDLGLENRISFQGSVSRNRILEGYAHSLAVFYGPFQEDFGFSSIEGLLSRKPVITFQDSGGVNEFVSDGITGCVCARTPTGIAEKINWLYNNPEEAGRLGENGFKRVSRLNWDYLLDQNILKYL
jgi:glycosyltransferase involved in cell wall biosynthesis